MLSRTHLSALVTIVSLLWCAAVFATEADCEPAVDMIESNDAVNRMAECDYSDRGINGWLANLGSRSKAAQPKAETAAQPSQTEIESPGGSEANIVLRAQTAGDALSLLQQRYQLVSQAAKRCSPAVAELVSEAYQADSEGAPLLLMVFRCGL
ncbi:hypothetical protein [Gilvimarinus sp. DA14]|uniref:hypothetical protein n=1 Tax=Gilvimarinus sp. DA14 TaxID=2956798 RepID=UPI0020B6A3C0|nr:hypothetical protein [Gilvimarinus sp. DA14]UTF61168.1 hypothetical protein NHM04_05045 [Gilvimarinus sp. DA14]